MKNYLGCLFYFLAGGLFWYMVIHFIIKFW